MACDITLGRNEPCKDSVGGIKAVYFINYDEKAYPTYDETNTDAIADLSTDPTTPTAITAYKWEVKGTSDLTQNTNSSRDTGTTYWEQVLNLTFKKLRTEDTKEIKLLSYGRPQIVVHDYNGNAFIVGLEHGADVTGGTIVTGTAMGDLSGYTLAFTGMERIPANHLEGSTIDDPFAGLTTPPDVVEEVVPAPV